MTAPYQPRVAQLRPIGLADLNNIAELQTRNDRKYVVPLPLVEKVITAADFRVLTIDGLRTFRYESVYFDTPDLVSYRAAAHRRRRRFKVRTRSYVDSGDCVLEVKTRERRGLTVKHRLPYEIAARDKLLPEAIEFVDGFDSVAPVSRRLNPSLTTRYRRTTLLDSATSSRITIDTGFEGVSPDGFTVALPDYAVVETKTDRHPCQFDRLLWGLRCRPTKISKYCTGMAALNPSLPANKWNRVLRRYFGWSPQPAPSEEIAPSADRFLGSPTGKKADESL